jgi:hypothetical protein
MFPNHNPSEIRFTRSFQKIVIFCSFFLSTLTAFCQGPPPPQPFVGCLPDITFDNWTYSGDNEKYEGITDANSIEIHFSEDGTKLYVLGLTNNEIQQHSLRFPFDISSAEIDADESFIVTNEETSPTGFALSSDGLKLFVIGTDSQRVHSYTLSTAFQISSAVYDGESASLFVGDRDNSPQGIAFNSLEGHLLVLGGEHEKVLLFDLTTPFDILGATFNAEFIFPSGVNLTSIDYERSGSDMYLLDEGSNSILRYFANLSNFSSSSSRGQLDLSATTTFPKGLDFAHPRVIVLDTNQNTILEFGSDLPSNYIESGENNGTITTNEDPVIFRLINAVGDEFIDANNDGILDGGVTIANLPNGLAAVFTLNDMKNEATLQLTGTAVNHDEDNDVIDLGIVFTPESNDSFLDTSYLCRLNISIDFESNAVGSVEDLLLSKIQMFTDNDKNLRLNTRDVTPQKMILYNLLGEEVVRINEFDLGTNEHRFPMNVAPGMYVVTLETTSGRISKKMIFH